MINIYDQMEDLVEERGNNPITEFGFAGPHEKLQNIYGSLLRPGNITAVCCSIWCWQNTVLFRFHHEGCR